MDLDNFRHQRLHNSTSLSFLIPLGHQQLALAKVIMNDQFVILPSPRISSSRLEGGRKNREGCVSRQGPRAVLRLHFPSIFFLLFPFCHFATVSRLCSGVLHGTDDTVDFLSLRSTPPLLSPLQHQIFVFSSSLFFFLVWLFELSTEEKSSISAEMDLSDKFLAPFPSHLFFSFLFSLSYLTSVCSRFHSNYYIACHATNW